MSGENSGSDKTKSFFGEGTSIKAGILLSFKLTLLPLYNLCVLKLLEGIDSGEAHYLGKYFLEF